MDGHRPPAVVRVFDHNYDTAQHADSNVNRLLGATAFLALGGFTLFFPSGHHGDLRFAGHGVRASDVFFFLFDLGIFFSVAFALAALHVGLDGGRGGVPGYRRLTFTELPFDDEEFDRRLGAAAIELADVVREKTVYMAHSRAAIEFAMIALAMMGTARLPDISRDAKSALIVTALGLYGFGACWRVGNRERMEYILESSAAAALLWTAPAFDAYWWAIWTALVWVAISRLGSPHDTSTVILRRVWLLVAIGILVYLGVR